MLKKFHNNKINNLLFINKTVKNYNRNLIIYIQKYQIQKKEQKK